MATLRLFTAATLPTRVCQALATLHTRDFDARWTPPQQFHLTLRFLGSVEEERVAAIVEALEAVQASPFSLQLDALGVFPSCRKPRVLIVRLMPEAPLVRLHRRIQDALATIGFPPETRRFRPHVTLARLKRPQPAAVQRYLETTAIPALSAFEITAFHLYQSILRPEGALHRSCASFPLAQHP